MSIFFDYFQSQKIKLDFGNGAQKKRVNQIHAKRIDVGGKRPRALTGHQNAGLFS